MFVIYNERTKRPIKTWLSKESEIDEKCLEQAYNLSQLPFIHKWVSLMPDTHAGMGMPIGGGNHFIELQEDEDGYLCIMIH